jgi:hypothetical protein
MNVIDKSIHVDRQKAISDQLASFALDLTFDAIPEKIRQRSKYLILDAVGIAYASQGFQFAGATMEAMTSLGAGGSPVIGYGRKLSPRDAALVNGVLAHGLDYDDTHSPGVIHATVSSLPLVLALGDELKISGRDFLTAYVAAMETSTRLASVAKGAFHQVGFHPTGLIGIFGCTLAASRLLGLGREQAAMAQGVALSMAAGSLEFLNDGAWTKRMHPGWAASSAITAATLAKHGFIGPRAAYEGRFGLFASHLGTHMAGADLALATKNLGKSWQIDEVAIKPIPACHFAHASGLGGLERDYGGNVSQAWLYWAARDLRGTVRPVRLSSRHAHGRRRPRACDQKSWQIVGDRRSRDQTDPGLPLRSCICRCGRRAKQIGEARRYSLGRGSGAGRGHQNRMRASREQAHASQ